VSWIHVDDLVNLIDFTIHTPEISGPLNFTAPNPVKMNLFGKTIGEVLQRPHWLPAPAFALKTLLGEMSILILEGQKVVPEKALKHHYKFLYPALDEALSGLLQST
jgi:NAD dependent epimerase/dehydratase family enzyme